MRDAAIRLRRAGSSMASFCHKVPSNIEGSLFNEPKCSLLNEMQGSCPLPLLSNIMQ